MHVSCDFGFHKPIIVPPSRPNDRSSMATKISGLTPLHQTTLLKSDQHKESSFLTGLGRGSYSLSPFGTGMVKLDITWAPPVADMQSASVSDFMGPTDELFSAIQMDEVLASVAETIKNFAVIYLVDITEVPDFNTMYELYDPSTIMFFFRNKHIMIDLGTGNNNKINWALKDKQEFIDIVETVFRGARKGRGLVIAPKDYSTKSDLVRSDLDLIRSDLIRSVRIETGGGLPWERLGCAPLNSASLEEVSYQVCEEDDDDNASVSQPCSTIAAEIRKNSHITNPKKNLLWIVG
uniref:Uncharacterized protein n=1 Tax=Fagus sylvatica TaxID=28930 RepID=A0A2N9HEW3_FAGSY